MDRASARIAKKTGSPRREACRAALQIDGVYGGASTLPNQGGVRARMLAVDAAALRAAMFAAWAAAREILAGAAPQPRRK